MMKPTTVDEYIERAPKEAKEKLIEMRECIRSVAPDAKESLKWSMPAFSYKRILVTYAVFTNHIGFYPTPSAINEFKKELSEYKFATGSVQFLINKPLPVDLIKRMVKFRVEESKNGDKKWKE